MRSFRSRKFHKQFALLPLNIQELARKNYLLWQANPSHPSLEFKPLNDPDWSVRVGDHYRVVGARDGDTILWYWIGSHEAYNKLF